MFMYHSALALGLIALATGCFLWLKTYQVQGPGRGVARFFAIVIMVISILSTACTLYYGMMFWKSGMFEDMMKIHEMRMQQLPEHIAKPEHRPAP